MPNNKKTFPLIFDHFSHKNLFDFRYEHILVLLGHTFGISFELQNFEEFIRIWLN